MLNLHLSEISFTNKHQTERVLLRGEQCCHLRLVLPAKKPWIVCNLNFFLRVATESASRNIFFGQIQSLRRDSLLSCHIWLWSASWFASQLFLFLVTSYYEQIWHFPVALNCLKLMNKTKTFFSLFMNTMRRRKVSSCFLVLQTRDFRCFSSFS